MSALSIRNMNHTLVERENAAARRFEAAALLPSEPLVMVSRYRNTRRGRRLVYATLMLLSNAERLAANAPAGVEIVITPE